ncbi:alpha/beta hydrolase [Massilia dura]|uniref:Acyl-CoA:diacylglycerol acyltransferase n=1 Tax=Pseudoduganella dura TaxID=321982 RepID=A0A6I3XFV5_9BURK|nr:alpha/beta hydrolase-fold protein [Pseudoduganella dura]MUI15327.1 alpha/beta hydrolase [Pseudoduganella dura]GGX80736.1 ferri-bacillibactin esterase BesA [Pseudoduganella dura]
MTAFPFSRRRLLAGGTAVLGSTLLPLAAHEAAAAAGDAEAWQPVMLPQARQRDMASAITGQRYRIFVSVPETPAPAAGHPVLYALDGNASFPVLALMARTAARRAGVTGLAAPVIVGIGYATAQDHDSKSRTRDYTPPAAGAPAAEGGADRFLDFIEQELKPLVRTLAPVDPRRQALYGHSFGGLCTLYTLFTRPAMFQTYVAASPSIWYGDRVVLDGLEGFAQRVAALPGKPSLLMTVGELEQKRPADARAGSHDAALLQRRMVDSARDLAARLQAGGPLLERVRFHELAHEDHGSAAYPAMARGIEFFMN